jgi:SAM-dependent methyltransferase
MAIISNASNYIAARDALAKDYDAILPNPVVDRAQQDSVWRELDRCFLPSQRVLEIDCSTGIDAAHLAERGVAVWACEGSPRMLELALQLTQLLRSQAADLLRRHAWIPAATTVLAVLALIPLIVIERRWWLVFLAVLAAACGSYVWGYTAHRAKQYLWPPLTSLQRRTYAETWDALATSPVQAIAAAAGNASESDLRARAIDCVRSLQELVSLGPADEVLEIGSGAGRVGLQVAPACRQWTGVDISANMLRYAEQNMTHLHNVRFVKLNDVSLAEFAENSFDLVYSVNVFAHLDEMDRWCYMQEAFRVLRPGGRIYVENIDLESGAGWHMFADTARRYRTIERPPYMPRFSTAAELSAYAIRAGFQHVAAHQRSPIVIITGAKSEL